jgi:bidirectional [NiFe] hydrogenase diaphorase subunit
MEKTAQAKRTKNEYPSGDGRYKAVDMAMKRFRYQKDALLEVLNTAQEAFGFLSEELMTYVADQLSVPLSQVYGVATFYHLFTFEPLGKHNCVICTGTACHVKGSDKIVDTLAAEFNVPPGGTTPDGEFSLTTARCLGSCGLAPVVVLDGQVMGKETPATAIEHVKAVLQNGDA